MIRVKPSSNHSVFSIFFLISLAFILKSSNYLCLFADVCQLPKDPGQCSKNKPERLFAYNAKTRKCEEFWYNGCLGNKNRFVTLEECRSVCVPEMKLAVSVYSTPIKPNISVFEQRPEYLYYSKRWMSEWNRLYLCLILLQGF